MHQTHNEELGTNKAPDWQPSTMEALVEAAALSSPHELYESNLFHKIGRARQNQFMRLVRVGIFEYEDGQPIGTHSHTGRSPALINFTEQGLTYVTETIGNRVDRLYVVHNSLLDLQASFDLEP